MKYKDKDRIMVLTGLCVFMSWLVIAFVRYCFVFLGKDMYTNFDLFGFAYFSVDYTNGLASRGLPGEILRWVIKDGASIIRLFAVGKTVILGTVMLLLSLLVTHICLRYDASVGMVTLFLFARPLYLVSQEFQIRNDNFWYVCLILIMVILFNGRVVNDTLMMLGVIVLSSIAMLVHQAFIFIFAPVICAILLVKYSYRHMIIYAGIIIAEFILLNFVFHGNLDYILIHAREFADKYGITGQYDKEKLERKFYFALREEYGVSKWDQIRIDDIRTDGYIRNRLTSMLFMMDYSLSSLIHSVRIIGKYVMEDIKKRWILVPMFVLPFILLIIFTCDYIRWFLMTLASVNIFAFFLFIKKKVEYTPSKKWWWLYYANMAALFFFAIVISY